MYTQAHTLRFPRDGYDSYECAMQWKGSELSTQEDLVTGIILSVKERCSSLDKLAESQ